MGIKYEQKKTRFEIPEIQISNVNFSSTFQKIFHKLLSILEGKVEKSKEIKKKKPTLTPSDIKGAKKKAPDDKRGLGFEKGLLPEKIIGILFQHKYYYTIFSVILCSPYEF